MQLRTQINAIDSQLASIEAQNAELRAKLAGLEKNVTAAPQVEREYANATRDLTIAREKYEQLLNRQMDAEVSESAIVGGRADEFRLIQAPMLPGAPSKPQRLAILLIGLVAAVVLGLTATVAAEALDPKVRGARDVRELLSVSPLVAIPDDSQLAFAPAQCLAVRRGHCQWRRRRVDRVHRHQELPLNRHREIINEYHHGRRHST